jgi:hypothetical protein
MGAWGYGPFETDGAGDWGTGLAQKIVAGVRSKDEEVARAAAAVMVATESTLGIPSDFVQDAIDRLEGILEDDDFIRSYDDEGAIVRALGTQISELKAMLRRDEARRARRAAHTAQQRSRKKRSR